MKTAFFDCFSGISGDMFIGSLIDAGLGFDALKKELSRLDIEGYEVSSKKVSRRGIRGTKFTVRAEAPGARRNLGDITRIISRSSLDRDVKEGAAAVFSSLARAEGKVHGAGPSSVHFHEIGGIDCIIDIVGSLAGLKMLGIGRVVCSEINAGSGSADSAHGRLPVPSPAAAELLKGVPLYSAGARAELATPTGAAIIKHVCSEFGRMPLIRHWKTGYGAGEKNLEFPNLLRVFIGIDGAAAGDETVILLEAGIDNMNPEFFGHAAARLFSEGALDVYMTPVYMKKQRPGTILSVICREESLERISSAVFRNTSSTGLRYRRVFRKTLPREEKKVKTEYGVIRVKISSLESEVLNAAPEYDDCAAAASRHKVALARVYDAAKKGAGHG